MTHEQLILQFVENARGSVASFLKVDRLLDDPTALFSLERFQAVLNNPLLLPNWLQVRSGGQLVSLDQDVLWKKVQGNELRFLDKSRLNSLLERGASAVVEGLDIMDARLNDLLGRLDRRFPCVLSNCVGFFSQADNEAYRGHLDTDDVLVLQVSGEKLWRVYATQPRRYANTFPLTEEQMVPLIDEFVMRPGDALYVKAGTPHRCHTSKPHSFHLSIDLWDRTPSVSDISATANQLYNERTAPAYAPAEEVIDTYVDLLQSRSFLDPLQAACEQIKQEAQEFRGRIGKTSTVTALSRFYKT